MADPFWGGIHFAAVPPHLVVRGAKDTAMLEILFMAQLMRNPMQAVARRWYCRGLFRATRGRRHCAECTNS